MEVIVGIIVLYFGLGWFLILLEKLKEYKIKKIQNNVSVNFQNEHNLDDFLHDEMNTINKIYDDLVKGTFKKYYISEYGLFDPSICPKCKRGYLEEHLRMYNFSLSCTNKKNCHYFEIIPIKNKNFKIEIKSKFMEDLKKAYN